MKRLQRLEKFYHLGIQGHVDEECKKGCLLGNMTQEMGGLSNDISNAADLNLKRIVGLINDCIAEGQAEGNIRDDYSSNELANFVHNSFYGSLIRTKAGRDRVHIDIFLKIIFDYLKP